MKIVVTGGNGFLGQWVIAGLIDAGHEVTTLSRNPVSQPTIRGISWNAPVAAIACDLAKSEEVRKAAPALAEAEAVVHLAAYVPSSTSSNTDADAFKALDTVRATVHLLAALRESTRLKAVVYASSFEVYGTPRAARISESHATEPLTYYGASKLIGEKYLRLFHTERGVPCTTLRFPAIYGPGDQIPRAIGNFIRNAASGVPLEIYGDGEDVRDLVYGADAARAIVAACEQPVQGVFNIGSGGITIKHLAESVQEALASDVPIKYHERQKPRLDYALEATQAEQILGWKPQISLEAGIRAQYEWLKSEGAIPPQG